MRIGTAFRLLVRLALMAMLALFAPTAPGAAHAVPTVRILETYPAGQTITLSRDQNFYLRLAYETDKPIGIWITPYFHGESVSAGTSPSIRYSGTGEALAWFFFMRPGEQADEIRIRAGDGGYKMPVVATYRVGLTGGSRPAMDSSSPWAPVRPGWVDALRAAADRQAEAESAASQGQGGAGGILFLGGFMLAVAALGLAALGAPVWAMMRWRGFWRLAAAAPLLLLGFVMVRIVIDTAADPTSHNLWPFEVLLTGFAGLGVLGLLALARRFGARRVVDTAGSLLP